MNFKIVVAIVAGAILSMATSVWSQGCIQVIVCDQYGNSYPTPCAFADAQKQNSDLVESSCPQ